MIRKVKAKRKRKNPYLVEYGYHFTNDKDLKSIIKTGLVPGFRKGTRYAYITNILKYFYNGRQPIYFNINKSTDNWSNGMLAHSENYKYNTWLKVNVRDFNQLPDIFMILDYGFEISNNNSIYLIDPDLYKDEDDDLYELLLKYNFKIPFKNLLKDKILQSAFINLTKSFCIDQRIPPKYIEEIIKVK